MNRVNINQHLNINHKEFFKSTKRTVIFFGGAGAGKTYSIADKLLIQCCIQEKLGILVIRKTFPSLRRTCIPIIESRAETLKIPYSINKSEYTATVNKDSHIYYLSMNNKGDYDKIKSITDIDMIWIEEANELSEPAYDLIDMRLRGGKGAFKQLIMSFNPVGMTSWIFQKFFTNGNGAHKIQTNAYDNPFIEKEYIEQLEALKYTNKNLHKVYCLGEWGQLQGVIYENYRIVDKKPDNIDEVIYGCDFGFNNQTAVVKICISDQVLYIEEVLYRTRMTNNDLIEFLKPVIVNHRIYCDSAEPQRIQEMKEAGLQAYPADKKVVVKTQIDYVKTCDLNILAGSENLIKEIQSYVWAEDANGKAMDEPVKFQDHLVDSMRYAIFTHIKKSFKFKQIGPDGLIKNT